MFRKLAIFHTFPGCCHADAQWSKSIVALQSNNNVQLHENIIQQWQWNEMKWKTVTKYENDWTNKASKECQESRKIVINFFCFYSCCCCCCIQSPSIWDKPHRVRMQNVYFAFILPFVILNLVVWSENKMKWQELKQLRKWNEMKWNAFKLLLHSHSHSHFANAICDAVWFMKHNKREMENMYEMTEYLLR